MNMKASAMIGTCEQPVMSERLRHKKERLESDLKEVNNALDLFEKNPDMKIRLCVLLKIEKDGTLINFPIKNDKYEPTK